MSWTIALVGDIMLDHKPRQSAAIAILQDADVAGANLEVPLSDQGYPADKPIVLRSPAEVAAHLPAVGLDVVSFANNHALDYGIPAFRQTIDVVEATGVRVTGAGADLDEALRPVITDTSGTKVAWLGFASTLPAGFAAAPGRPGIAPIKVENSLLPDAAMSEEQPGTSSFVATRVYEGELDRAVGAVGGAAELADVVIVHIHWGVPPGFAAGFQGTLAQYQRPLARALVDAGATVIVGHHPHCLHGIEIIDNSLVLYSVGHFVFHALATDKGVSLTRPGPPYRLEAMFVPQLRETGIFLLHFDDQSLTQLEIIPCVLNDEGESEIATGPRAASIMDWVKERSREYGTELKIEGERGLLFL